MHGIINQGIQANGGHMAKLTDRFFGSRNDDAGDTRAKQDKVDFEFYAACLDRNVKEAARLAEKTAVSPSTVRHGLLRLVGTQKGSELEGLIKKADVNSDPGFGESMLYYSRDKLDTVRLLNTADAQYTYRQFCTLAVDRNDEAGMAMLKSGKMDVTGYHSISLLYAAMSGMHGSFDELMKRGASPEVVLKNIKDPRYEDGIKLLRQWSAEYRQKNGPKPVP